MLTELITFVTIILVILMQEKFILQAYKESLKAFKKNEIPVGCVIVKNNKIISKAHNNRQHKYNLLGHSEINAIIKAEKKIKDWRLDDCTMYVTLFPCKMCQILIKESRIKKVYYLVNSYKNIKIDEKKFIKLENILLLSDKYNNLLKKFFEKLRN